MHRVTHNEVIQKIVDAAKSELRPVLKILFVNHRLIPTFKVLPEKEALGLIRMHGKVEEAARPISLAKSKFSMRIGPDLSRHFGPLSSTIEQLSMLKDQLKPEMIPELINYLISYRLTEPILLLEKAAVEGIIAFLLESLIILWRKQPNDLRDAQLVDSLSQLGLIEPQLQVSLCIKCGSFELTMGSCPLSSLLCSKCNVQRVCVRLYLFNEQFSQFKNRDRDLPLFICRYMQAFSGFRIQIEPYKMFPPDVELDVYVKDSDTDIECTTLFREELAIDEEDVKSLAGHFIGEKIEKKLNTFLEVGIKRVVFITNLLKDDSRRLEKEIQERLKAKNIKFEIHVIPGILEDFINTLDEEVKIAIKSAR